MPLVNAALDHVAVAVDDVDAALAYWYAQGATRVAGGVSDGFRSAQVRFANGAKLECIGRVAGADHSFIDSFLQRFGTGTIHHVTVKTPGSIRAAAASLASDGIDVVDLRDDWSHWHEAFVRPSVVGGLVAQVAWSDGTDADWARRSGQPPAPPINPDAPSLNHLVLAHDDLDVATHIWTSLGAQVTPLTGSSAPRDQLVVSWPGSPLQIIVAQGVRRSPIGLMMSGIAPTAASEDVRPMIFPG